MKTAILFLFSSLVIAAPSPEAIRIANSALLVDGHNDLPWSLRQAGDMSLTKFNLLNPQNQFHTDIPRLKKGGLTAQFWSVYVPVEASDPVKMTLEQIDLVHRMIKKYPDYFEYASTAADIERIVAKGKIASLIGMEGGHSIDSSLNILGDMYNKGARYMTLTHSKNTPWADACTDRPEHNGLTALGKQIVKEMNRLHMFVDISHVSPKTMKDAIATSTAPVIFSHSSAWALKNHVRNVPDDVLKMMPKNGGVVMVNFYKGFVCNAGHPCNVKTVANHIDHVVKMAGVDYVGLGSDYDGVDELPEGLEDVTGYANLVQELLDRGYKEPEIKKIMGQNLIRAMKQMEQTN